MPVYEYVCPKCQHQTEALRPMRQADDLLACPQCGHQKTKRVQSVFTAATASAGKECPLPMGGCGGRCNNPDGPCGLE